MTKFSGPGFILRACKDVPPKMQVTKSKKIKKKGARHKSRIVKNNKIVNL